MEISVIFKISKKSLFWSTAPSPLDCQCFVIFAVPAGHLMWKKMNGDMMRGRRRAEKRKSNASSIHGKRLVGDISCIVGLLSDWSCRDRSKIWLFQVIRKPIHLTEIQQL